MFGTSATMASATMYGEVDSSVARATALQYARNAGWQLTSEKAPPFKQGLSYPSKRGDVTNTVTYGSDGSLKLIGARVGDSSVYRESAGAWGINQSGQRCVVFVDI